MSLLWGAGVAGVVLGGAGLSCSGKLNPDGSASTGGSAAEAGASGGTAEQTATGGGEAPQDASTGGADEVSGGGTGTGGSRNAGGTGEKTAGLGGSDDGSSGGRSVEDGAAGSGPECVERACTTELEDCVSGTCQANETVREQTEMVLVPGGTFLMGAEDLGASAPVHERTLPAFYMDRTEVTARAYELCVRAGACTEPDTTDRGSNFLAEGFEDYPINYVSLLQADAYCAWMGKRLPTEAEWEYAAGGRQGHDYPWGDSAPSACLTMYIGPDLDKFDFDHGCPVAQYPANENGLFDMAGSMYEYTSSPYCAYSDETDSGYVADCDTEFFARKDGGFTAEFSHFARVAFREPTSADGIYQSFGFRCAADE